MTDFAFRVTADATAADRSIEGVLSRLDRIEAEARASGMALQSSFQAALPAIQGHTAEMDKVRASMLSLRDVAKSGVGMLGIGFGAAQLVDLADGFTNVRNRLTLMTGDVASANALFEDLRDVANRTRSDLTSTVDAFAGVSRATKQMGLSQRETIRVTETLNALVAASGKPASDSAAALTQLSQALSSGVLQGDEFRSVAEGMPSLMDALQKSLGKTQAELRAMSSQGQITSKVMIDALMGASQAADDGLAKSIPTISQSLTILKNDLAANLGPTLQSITQLVMQFGSVIGTVNENLGGLKLGLGTVAGFMVGGPFGAAIGTAIESAQSLIDRYGRATDVMRELAEEQARTTEAMIDGTKSADDLVKSGMSAMQAIQNVIAAEATGIQNYQTAIENFTKAGDISIARAQQSIEAFVGVAARLRAQLAGAADEAQRLSDARTAANMKEAMRQYEAMPKDMGAMIDDQLNKAARASDVVRRVTKEVDEYAKTLQSVLGPQQEAVAQLNILGQLYMNSAITLEQYTRAAEKHRDVLRELGILQTKSMTTFDMIQPMDLSGIDPSKFAAPTGIDPAAGYEAEQARMEALTQSWHDRLEQMRRDNEAFAASFSPIGDVMRDAFMKGEIGAKSLDQAMRQIAFNLFRFMGQQAGAALGAQGGAAGFAGAALSGIFGGTPGMATGGVVYAGNGGTDSQLVAFRKSPSEHMTTFVETQTQYNARMMGGGAGAAPPVNLAVLTKNDEHEITSAFMGSAGETAVAVVSRKWRKRNR